MVVSEVLSYNRFVEVMSRVAVPNVAMLVHSRHRSFENFIMNVLSVIAAYCFFDKKPAINMDFEIGDPMLPTLF